MKNIVVLSLIWSLIVGNTAFTPQPVSAQDDPPAAATTAADANNDPLPVGDGDADLPEDDLALAGINPDTPLPPEEVDTPGALGPTFVSIAAAFMAWSLKGCMKKKSWDRVPLFTLVTAASVFLFKEMRTQDDFKNQSSMPLMKQRFEDAEGAKRQVEGLRLAAMQSELAAEAAEGKAGNARLFKRMLYLSGTLYGAFAIAHCAKQAGVTGGMGIGACLARYSSCKKTEKTRSMAGKSNVEKLRECQNDVNCELTEGQQEIVRTEGHTIDADGQRVPIQPGQPGSTMQGPPAPEGIPAGEPPTLTGEPAWFLQPMQAAAALQTPDT